VDNEVGAAGRRGKGEENIKTFRGHTIIEMMRQGKSPTGRVSRSDGCGLRAITRTAEKLGTFHIYFYAINKDGRTGPLRSGATDMKASKQASYAVHDGTESRLVAWHALF